MTGEDAIVVGPGWLSDRLDEVRVVDVRERWEYEGIGHVPGAVPRNRVHLER